MPDKTTKKNDLTAAELPPLTKEQVFAFIDTYFAEGQADISFEISRDDVRKHLGAELATIERAGKLAQDAIIQAAGTASAAAREAHELAQRKAGGNFTVEIKQQADRPAVKVKNPHKQFADLLAIVAAGCNAYMAGPAGSGKTTAAQQVAESLKLPFFFTGAVATEWKLTGFVDAQGKYHRTPFRDWCEQGGVFLWDEIDGSDARALLSFNAALANGVCEFPDGKVVTLHKSCVAIAAANTYGQGADRVYVGRNQLDAASLDRFVFIGWEYDEDLEERIAGNQAWARRVQAVRKAAEGLKIRAVISPRASIYGARLLAQGLTQDKVEALTLWKGMDAATVAKVKAETAV